jgi:hypothetical protein
MAKDPAFLFYPNDWLGGTMAFSRHEKGCYIDLLMCQFNEGHMESHMVMSILGENDYNSCWEKKLKKKFKIDSDGKYYNEKLDNEVIKRKNYTESRRKNLSHKDNHMLSHMGQHMENGNINVLNSKKNEKTKNGKNALRSFSSQGEDLYAERLGRKLSEHDSADGTDS